MYLIAWLLLITSTTLINALYVTDGSPCAATCNYTNGTFWPDLVCADSDFSTTTKGQLVRDCLRCQGQSLYVNGTRSDEWWYMFHMKYSQQSCLIDTNIPHSAAIQACSTECAPLRTVLSVLWLSTTPYLPQYNYCTGDSNAYPTYAPKCGACLQAQAGAVILGNMVQTMVDACVTRPLAVNGSLVKVSRDVFNSTVIPLSSNTPSSSASSASSTSTQTNTATQSSKPAIDGGQGLSGAAGAGIGVGIAVVLIIAAAGGWFIMRRRKRSHMINRPDEPAPAYYAAGRDTKDPKHGKVYREMHAEPFRVELDGHETKEADGRAVGKAAPVAELPASPYR